MYNKNCLIISDAFITEVRNKIPEVKNLTDADIKATISANQTKEGEIPSIDVLKKAFSTRKQATINIYFSTGENKELSNLAKRPFVHTWKDGKTTQFDSVEQAFQFAKARMANDRETARKILEAKSSAEAKALGRQVKNLDSKAWDSHSSAIMKVFLRESFEQNPKALQILLATKTATLTHIQDKGKWGTEFPKLLMEVREELRASNPIEEAVDYSVLQEISNLTFRNAQRKADRVNLIARLFSQVATKQYEKALLDNPKLSRSAFIVRNVDEILSILKDKILNPQMINPDAIDDSTEEGKRKKELAKYRKVEFPKIQDNWKILLGEAANILYTTEGISIDIRDNVSHNEGDETGTFEDDTTPDGENQASIKDGWMVKARELDLRDTLSAETRKILGSIRRTKRDGSVDFDDLGFARYLNPDQTHLTLLEKISTINSADEFIPALQELAKKNPWVNQILLKIEEDNKNPFPTIAPKLYTDLRKEFLPYYVQVKNTDGTLVTKQVNKTPSIFYLLDRWRMVFEQGTVLSDYSIYNNRGEYSKKNANVGKKITDDILTNLSKVFKKEDISSFVEDNVERVSKLLNMVGIDFTNEEILDTLKVGNSPEVNLRKLLGSLSTIFDQVSKKDYKEGTDLINEFSGAFSDIATLFNTIPQGSVIATFREAGRTRQSYSAPSYMGRLFNGLKAQDRQKVAEFLYKNFGKYRQFKDETGFRNYWLSLMEDRYSASGKLIHDGQKYRNLLDRKIVIHREGKEFDEWTESDYLAVAMMEFFGGSEEKKVQKEAYYPLPLLADAPSAEFIKFIKFTDADPDYILPDGSGFMSVKDIVLDKLAEVALWEWERIQLVKTRDSIRRGNKNAGESEVSPIKYFDESRGSQFNFFPFLNNVSLQLENKSRTEQLALLRAAIKVGEEASFEEFVSSSAARPLSKAYTREQFEDFFYNNAFAYTQMVQLLTTDLAYYKNLNDFQKRFKEVYAMTNRLYTAIPGISKQRKVVNLKDIEYVSPLLSEVESILSSAVDRKSITEEQKRYILGQWGDKVNVTDAQGFVTLNAYRKVMRMTGNWTQEMEDAKGRLESGEFSFDDFNIIWQTLKPFMFTSTDVRSGVQLKDANGNLSPYGDLKVPIQYKNSEFLLLAIYNSIAQSQSKSPMLRALNKWANANDIDLVQFDSGVKAGSQCSLDLNQAITEKWSENAIRDYLDASLNNPDRVHLVDWEDYGIQSATPEHLIDHEALIGSQAKKLIFADLPANIEIYLQGNKFSKEAAYQLFQSLMVAGYVDGFEKCVDIFSSNENLAKAIQKEMAGSTRYTEEEREACTLNEDGDFNIPLYESIQSQRIQQLLNSIIKKAVTKQQTIGAACIQVSNFGLTDELNIRFKDNDGNLIPTFREYLKENEGATREDYEKYRKERGATSIAYYECYLPAYTKKFFDVLGRNKGNFNINDLPEDLRKCLGYRIPTESKYSMQAIYIKGFLPQQNGSAIMLPAEITSIVGSDFDIDKVYLMLPSCKVKSRAEESAFKAYKEVIDKSVASVDSPSSLSKEDKEKFREWLKEQRNQGRWIPEKGDKYLEKDTINLRDYITTDNSGHITSFDLQGLSRTSKAARDNALLDMFFEILGNRDAAPQILKHGGFDEASRNAAVMTVLQNMTVEQLCDYFKIPSGSIVKRFEQAFTMLNSLSKDEAKKLADKSSKPLNPLSFATQTYFHSQNSNGGKMIGVYAVGNASHSIGEWGRTYLKTPMTFLGLTLQEIDKERDNQGNLISENLANFLAASVDNVKDPVLKALNQDTSTGDITNFLLRAGVSLDYVAAFMTAPKSFPSKKDDIYQECLQKVNTLTVNDLRYISAYDTSKFVVTSEDTPEQAKEKAQLKYKYDVILGATGLLYREVQKRARDLTKITQAFRGDALSSAAGPSIGHNIVRFLKLQSLANDLAVRESVDADGNIVYIDNNPSFTIRTDLLDTQALVDNSGYTSILEDSMKQNVPFVYAATKAGVTGSNYLLKNCFPQLRDNLLWLVTDKEVGLSRYVDLIKMPANDAAKLVDTFYSEFFLYLLNGTKYFGSHNGSNAKENAKYYLTKFPFELTRLKEKYPEIFNTNSLTRNLYVSTKVGEYPRIQFSNSGNLTKGLKGTITNDWAMLLATQEQKEIGEDGKERITLTAEQAAEIRDFGFELFKYATFSGLEFSGSSSFIQLAPNVLKRAIRDYDRTIRNVGGQVNGILPFVSQFIHNHLEEDVFGTRVPISKVKFEAEGVVSRVYSSSTYPAIIAITDDNTGVVYKYEIADEEVLEKENGKRSYKITYKLTSRLGVAKKFKEYYFGELAPETIVGIEEQAASSEFSYDPQYAYTEEDEEFDVGGYDASVVPTVSTYDERGNQTTLCQ